MDIKEIIHNRKSYAVIPIKNKRNILPVVISYDDLEMFIKVNKKWAYSPNGFIYCKHKLNDKIKDVYLHEFIMALNGNNRKATDRNAVVHINRICLDNRRENLMYDNQEKKTNKNMKKRLRNTELPENSGIDANEVPTYVWYMKPNGDHNDRFMVKIGDVSWKTTSSSKVSLRYKLEEAKLYLRQLKKDRPELFQAYSMNGDLTKDGLMLSNEYHEIIEKAGYSNIEQYIPNNTEKYIKPARINKKESQILKKQSNLLEKGQRNRRITDNLPKDCSIKPEDIPKYAYYRPPYKNRGGFFAVEKHPNQTQTIWRTTSSKSVSIEEKFQDLMDFLDGLE